MQTYDGYINPTTLEDFDADESSELSDALELLREQVETLKQELRHKELELQETEQELRYTNHELGAALSLERLTLDEAKKLAKNILASEKPASVYLAELLSAIYGSLVKADELEPSSLMTPLTSDREECIINHSKVLKSQLGVIVSEANELRAQSMVHITEANELRARSRVLKGRFVELGSRFVSFKARFIARQAESRQSR